MALTAAVAAGVGAASTAAGTQPWIASLNGMAQAGHATTGATGKMAGKNVFDSVRGAGLASQAAGAHAAKATRPGQAVATTAAPVQVADQQSALAGHQSAPAGHQPAPAGHQPALAGHQPAPAGHQAAPVDQPGGIQALRPLPRHAAPLVPVRRPAALGRALAAPAPRHAAPAAPPPVAPKPRAVAPKPPAVAPKPPAVAPKPAPVAPKPPPPQPYSIYDSVSPGHIPSAQQQVAVYGNGSYQASWSSVHGRHRVLWIDTNGTNPGCDALDVEPGDATPAAAARWVQSRLHEQPDSIAIVYTMMSEWSAVKSAIGSLPGEQQSHVRYWIADPTGVRHLVPGSSATQWYWGSDYDITTAQPNFDS